MFMSEVRTCCEQCSCRKCNECSLQWHQRAALVLSGSPSRRLQ